MENTNTAPTKADDTRQIVANQIFGGGSAGYFNPLIGISAGKTCANIDQIMEMLYGIYDGNMISEDMNPGIKLIIQTVWSAVQYESAVHEIEKSA